MSQALILQTASDFWFQDSLKKDDCQVERLDSDLQNQVTKLALALKEITKRERQQIIERVNEDCAKVRADMSQTMNIQHYLNLLLAETDPFLLIWVRHLNQYKQLYLKNRKQSNVHKIMAVNNEGINKIIKHNLASVE